MVNLWQGQDAFLFFQMSTPTTTPSQSPTQSLPHVLSPGQSNGIKPTSNVRLVSMLR